MTLTPSSPDASESRPHVAIAILHQLQPDGSLRFLMQLRDDIPGIAYPAHWGFFGGHVEPGEHPDDAVRRELLEEINYMPEAIDPFKIYNGPRSIRHVYGAKLETTIDALTLGEGWDMKLVTIEEIKSGECYSSVAQQVKPIGAPHQAILLEFLSTQTSTQPPVSS
ncbi:MAG: NUDIX hydrolase [Cyanobacteria bacterium J06627_8]